MNAPRRLSLFLLLVGLGASAAEPSLKEAYAPHFRLGVALSTASLTRPEPEALALAAEQFNSITPENLLKWENVHPERDRYDFAAADRFVEFGAEHGMWLVGHTLVWHSQTPAWVFQDDAGAPLTRDALLERMREHIHAVIGRYRGRIQAWDVVNEAVNDDGTLRDSPWRTIIGDDFLEYAFRYAHEADPDAELYYNDYSMHLAGKRAGVVRIVKGLKAAGCRIDGIGMQEHLALHYPGFGEVEASIGAFAAAAGKVMITELDLDVLPRPNNLHDAEVSRRAEGRPALDPFRDGLPATVAAAQADRYARFFKLYLKHADAIDRVTLWGLDDGRSWHNGWPIRGRTAHSLLFDRQLAPKPAYQAVIEAARTAGPGKGG